MKKLLLTIFSIVAVFIFLLAGSPDLSALSFENNSRFKYTIISETEHTVEIAFSSVASNKNVLSLSIPEEVEYEGVTYSVIRIGKGGFENMPYMYQVTVPSSVKQIGEEAFRNCPMLTTVRLPEDLTEIRSRTFDSCTALVSIDLPSEVTEIGYNAFANCTSLQSVVLPESVVRIGSDAFSCCTSLQTVLIPNSVTEIGSGAFSNCSSLRSIYIPASVVRIGSGAFSQCSNLTSFEVDNDNPAFCSTGPILYNRDMTIGIAYPTASGKVEIQEGTVSIGSDFLPWSRVTELYIPASLKTVPVGSMNEYLIKSSVDADNPYFSEIDGNLLDKQGTKLLVYTVTGTEITLPDYVTEIGTFVLYYNRMVQTVNIPSGITKINQQVAYSCPSLRTVNCYAQVPPELDEYCFLRNTYSSEYWEVDVFVPAESVEQYRTAENWKEYSVYPIGYVFRGTKIVEGDFTYTVLSGDDLTVEVTSYSKNQDPDADPVPVIPATIDYEGHTFTVISLGRYLFSQNSHISSVVLPSTLESIEWMAFNMCENLTSIRLPSSLKIIGSAAFLSSGLKSVFIPAGVSYIFDYAFGDTDVEIEVSEENPIYCSIDGALYNKEGDVILEWPAASGDVVLTVDVKNIGDYAFYKNDKIRSFSIPFSVERINGNAFKGCENLSVIYCYPFVPPMIVYEKISAFDSYDVDVYVPASAFENYSNDPEWNKFNLFPMDSKEIDCLVVNSESETPLIFRFDELTRINFVDEGLEFVGETTITVPFSDISSISFDYCTSLSVDGLYAEETSDSAVSVIGDILRISHQGQNAGVYVYSVAGTCVLHINDYSGEDIDISSLPRGIYLVKAGDMNYKFIK